MIASRRLIAGSRSADTRSMSRSLAEYVALGYALSAGDRLKAARMLRLSVDQGVDSDREQVDAAWRDEVGARVCDILVGAAELVDADETYRMLSAELGPSIGDARIASRGASFAPMPSSCLDVARIGTRPPARRRPTARGFPSSG